MASDGKKDENTRMIKLFEKKAPTPGAASSISPSTEMMVEEIDFLEGEKEDASYFQAGLAGKATHYLLTDKWNGCNIQFFKVCQNLFNFCS